MNRSLPDQVAIARNGTGRTHRGILVVVTLAGVCLWPSAAEAADSPLDRFAVRAGGFVTRFDTTIRSDGSENMRGTEIDFDRELGLEDHDLIEFASIEWLPWPHHEFGLGYFRESLEGTRRLERNIVFGDQAFAVDTTLHSALTLEAIEFHYTYWPLVRERWALGLRFGYMDYQVRTRLELLLAESGEPPDIRVSISSTEYIPAPSVGIDFRLVPAQDWRINANVGWFEAEFETVSPLIATARVGFEYMLWEHVGLWADFGMTRLDADVHSSRFDGQLVIYEGGLRLGLIYRH